MGSQELKFFDIKGKLIDLTKQEKKAVLILFFDPTDSYQKGVLVYAQVLYEKYKNMGLQILGIANKEKEKINIFYFKYYNSLGFFCQSVEHIHSGKPELTFIEKCLEDFLFCIQYKPPNHLL